METERELRNLMANSIVAQMIGDGVVKGGTGLKFRYGEKMSRVTLDLDTAWRTDLDGFLKGLKARLSEGWTGFTGEVHVLRPASPKAIPFEYVMQPCDVARAVALDACSFGPALPNDFFYDGAIVAISLIIIGSQLILVRILRRS